MRNLDFSSWQSILVTVIGLALFTLIGIGIRLLLMFTIQQRRERFNRQINERLKTLIAAYKVLGGSFTGTLTVNPIHLRDLHKAGAESEDTEPTGNGEGSDRARRIRDAVEAALSDIILLGTEEQVRLAEQAARALVSGQPVHTHDLVVSLRSFIREALDLEPIPADLSIPLQGPTRPSSSSGGRGRGDATRSGAGGGGAGGGAAGGGGMGGGGMGAGLVIGGSADEPPPPDQRR